MPRYTARISIGCAPKFGLSKENWPCASDCVFATGCIPPCNWMSITVTPEAGFPVVPFFTVPCTVPACATFLMGQMAHIKIAARIMCASLGPACFTKDLARLQRDEARGDGALAI